MLAPVAPAMDTLREAVRRAAGPQSWSRGVELCRRGAVQVDARSDEEITARVATRGGLFSPLVTLYPADPAWSCECDSRAEACEHVAAVIIALGEPDAAAPADVAAPAARGLVGYRLTRGPAGPALARVVVAGCAAAREEIPLDVSLVAIATGRVDGPAFMATPADLACEQALGTFRGGVVPRELWPRLLFALSRCRDVRLDGAPVAVSVEQVTPVVRVQDHGMGFRLQLVQDPRATERLAPGVVLCGDRLHPFADAPLNARERENLARGLAVPAERAGWLVSELLPSLAGRLPLLVETTRLPRSGRSAPRALVETRRDGDALVVQPRIVYGDPPVAYLDGDRLLVTGSPVPVRDETAERHLARELTAALGVRAGVELRLEPRDAIAFAERLRAWGASGGGAGPASVTGDAHAGVHARAAAGAAGDARSRAVRGRVPQRGRRRRRTGPGAARRRGSRHGGLARPRAAGAAARGRLRAAPCRLAGAARSAARGPARRTRRSRPPGTAQRCPALARLAEQLGEPPPPELAALAPLYAATGPLPRASLPVDLAATLRGYQRDGVDWLVVPARAPGSARCSPTTWASARRCRRCARTRAATLVVCPTSVLHNWAGGDRAASGPACARSRLPRRRAARSIATADVTLTTYALLRLDADALAAEPWDTVVLDEAQAIKNPDSQVARAAYRLPRALPAGAHRHAGREPARGALEPAALHQPRPARRPQATSTSATPGRSRPASRGAAERLRERIRPFVLRRLKREVAPELPPRTEVGAHVRARRATSARSTTRSAPRRATRSSRGCAPGGSVLEALEALLRLRQAACHPALVPGQQAETSSKVELLLEALDERAGRRATRRWSSRSGPRCSTCVEPHARARGDRASLRLDGSTRDRGGGGRALPGRRRPAGDAGLAQGGRHRAQPHRGRPRVPARPVVEPGRRGPGRRPRPPHRPGQAGDRLPAGRARTRSRSGSSRCRSASARWPRRRSDPAGGRRRRAA